MTGRSVVVLDYGSGNLRSAQRALERVALELGIEVDGGAKADGAAGAAGEEEQRAAKKGAQAGKSAVRFR